MNELLNKFRNLPTDKSGHAALGAILSAIVFFVSSKLSNYLMIDAPLSLGLACSAGIMASLLAGIIKEVFDSRDPEHHSVDKYDVIATTVGGVVGVVIMAVLKVVIF